MTFTVWTYLFLCPFLNNNKLLIFEKYIYITLSVEALLQAPVYQTGRSFIRRAIKHILRNITLEKYPTFPTFGKVHFFIESVSVNNINMAQSVDT